MVRQKKNRADRKDSTIATLREPTAPADSRFLDRELSQLAFNERVLALAERATVPLAERLRFLCIVSSNLDEFFEIRVAGLMEDMREGGGIGPATPFWPAFADLSQRAHVLVERQYNVLNKGLTPAFEREQIVILSHS